MDKSIIKNEVKQLICRKSYIYNIKYNLFCRNPTPTGSDFKWIPATKENKECLVISDEFQMKTNLNKDRVQFWDDFLEKYQKQAVDGVVMDVKDEL